MSNLSGYIKGFFLIVATLLAFSSARTIMEGNLEAGLTPGWINFAIAHPLAFALIAVIGATLVGGSFVAILENG